MVTTTFIGFCVIALLINIYLFIKQRNKYLNTFTSIIQRSNNEKKYQYLNILDAPIIMIYDEVLDKSTLIVIYSNIPFIINFDTAIYFKHIQLCRLNGTEMIVTTTHAHDDTLPEDIIKRNYKTYFYLDVETKTWKTLDPHIDKEILSICKPTTVH